MAVQHHPHHRLHELGLHHSPEEDGSQQTPEADNRLCLFFLTLGIGIYVLFLAMVLSTLA